MTLEISAETVLSGIARADAPLIVDVCSDDDFAAAPRLLPGAVRIPFAMAARHPVPDGSRGAIIVCQKGLKLSQGVSAQLRAAGHDARYLGGGMRNWLAAGLPTISGRPDTRFVLPDTGADGVVGTSLSHWMLRRFAPAGSEILIVPTDSLSMVADRFDATPLPSAQRTLAFLDIGYDPLDRLHRALTGAGALLRGMIATAASHSTRGSPQDPTLSLLDAAYETLADRSVA